MSNQPPRRPSRSRRRLPLLHLADAAVDPGEVPVPRDDSVSRHQLRLLVDQCIADQPAEEEDRAGVPRSKMFLHMRGVSRYVRSVRECWNGTRPLRVADVTVVTIKDVNREPLLDVFMKLQCGSFARTW